jgi:hypothetical protein
MTSTEAIQTVEENYSNYDGLYIYFCHQNEENVLDWNGLESVFCKTDTKLKYPSGIGSLG